MTVATPRRPVQSIDPNSGVVWGEHSPATPEEVRQVVDRARAAQVGWAATPLRDRARALAGSRAFTRFLTGLSSPRQTRGKLKSHPLFGAFADVPFAEVLRRGRVSPGAT